MKQMPPINIQISDQCISCGACVQVCPMGVLLYENPLQSKKPTITDASVCICCGQCLAVCPQDAITNSHLELDDFPKIDAVPSVEWNQFIALTRQRRSIRNFSHDKPVPRELIEKILDESTRYAPTGHNRQAAEILIIGGKHLEEIRNEINAVILRLYKYLKYTHWISEELELHWRQMRLWKRMIESGLDPATRNAPCIALFITDNRVKENEIDAAILSYQTLLSAEILGLNSCYFGALRNSLPFSRKLHKLLNLPLHRIVVCGLLLGYTQIKYRRLVSRKALRVYG